MQRVNWINIASWIVLCVCIVLATSWCYFNWHNLTLAQDDKQRVNQLIAQQNLNEQKITQTRTILAGYLAVQDTGREDAEFLSQLQTLMIQSNVKPVQIDRTPLTPLASLTRLNPTASNGSSGNKEKAKLESSLINLPMGTRAVSSHVTVRGDWINVHHFLYALKNYRYQVRTINTNSLQVALEEKGQVKATMTLTRFIRPNDTKLTPIQTEAPITPSKTGAAYTSPNTPGMPGNPESPQRPVYTGSTGSRQ